MKGVLSVSCIVSQRINSVGDWFDRLCMELGWATY